jgi:hypothetical protein
MIGPVLYAVALFLVLVVLPGTITLLKGQKGAFLLGFLLLGLIWSVAACRLARPDSYWATRFYGPRKLARARERFGT